MIWVNKCFCCCCIYVVRGLPTVFNVSNLILQIQLFCFFYRLFSFNIKNLICYSHQVFQNVWIKRVWYMNAYQLNPVQFNTNTEVGEVVFMCTYINKVLMFHWKHVQLNFCMSNVVKKNYKLKRILSWEVHSCVLFQRAARGSWIFSNIADILTEVMHVYSTGGLICYWRIRGNYESFIVHYI